MKPLEFRAERVESPEEVVYDRFSPRVSARLGRYVYRLVDPRDGETFYVGRGVGNRIFDHMDEAADGERSAKTARINAIHHSGFKVVTVIHRHALRDEDETATLEAALIQAYPNLTNQVSGEGTRDFGMRPTEDVIRGYDHPPAQLNDHKCVLLSLSESWPRQDDDGPTAWTALYAMARHGWKLDVKRAQKAEWVVAHARGIVRAVFSVDEWRPSSDPTFAGFPRPKESPAFSFIGHPSHGYAWDAWVGRRVPDKWRTRFGGLVRFVNV